MGLKVKINIKENTMEIRLSSAILSIGLACGILCAGSVEAAAPDISGLVKTIMAKGKVYGCRKGEIAKGIISIRSFEGRLCQIKAVQAYAWKFCQNEEGFKESKCAKNIPASIKGE